MTVDELKDELKKELPVLGKEMRCDNCLNWKKIGNGEGECRRRAPALVLNKLEEFMAGAWPLTHALEWCGEYRFNRELTIHYHKKIQEIRKLEANEETRR